MRWVVFGANRRVIGSIMAPDYRAARCLAWAMYETAHVSLSACEKDCAVLAFQADYRARTEGAYAEIMCAIELESAK